MTDDEQDAVKRLLALLKREQQRATDGTMDELSPAYSRAIIKQYADALRAVPPSARASLLDFSLGDPGGVRRSQTSATSYVYCWCDAQDNAFYVGKGYGKRAWAKVGHDHALRYATHFLNGEYSVHILCDRLIDKEAFEIEEALIGRFGNALANWGNSCLILHLLNAVQKAQWARPGVRGKSELQMELRRIVRAYPAGESRIEPLLKFVTELRELEQAEEEEARSEALEFAHISLLHRMRVHIKDRRLNAVLADAVSRLVSELWRLGRNEEVVAAVDEFRESHPSHFEDIPCVLLMASRDKALLVKGQDAARRLKGDDQP